MNNIDFNVGVITTRWNREIINNLKEGVEKIIPTKNIIYWEVPGSFELIYASKLMQMKTASMNIKSIIVLGSLIRGETKHFDVICDAVSIGIKDINIKYDTPVVFGVLTDYNREQAIKRSKYKGEEFGKCALDMAELYMKNR